MLARGARRRLAAGSALNVDALPLHWRGRARFVVLDTAFGTGSAFLATRAAWQRDANRCAVLHYIGAQPLGAPVPEALSTCWPPATPNLHSLVFDGGAIQLLLAFGALAVVLAQIEATVDAFLVDDAGTDAAAHGRAIARLAAPGAVLLATSASPAFGDALRRAGFLVRVDGSTLDATFAPRFRPPAPARRAAAQDAADEPVLIVGAGLAGCATACALAELGRSSIVLERAGEPASGGSGNAVGLFHGVVHRGDGRHARFHRAAALAADRAVAAAMTLGEAGSTNGLLRVEPRFGRNELQGIVDRLGLPPEYVRALDAEEASRLAGTPITSAAWFYPRGGWVDPRGLCRAYLARAGSRVTLVPGCTVAALHRDADRWLVAGAGGTVVGRAAVVVLACAGAALDLLGTRAWPVRRTRGQVSSWPACEWPAGALPRLPVSGAGYVAPAVDGAVWFGATSDVDVGHGSEDTRLRDSDHRRNVARLGTLLTLVPRDLPAALGGRVGFRWSADDRLPVIGPVPDASGHGQHPPPRLDQPRDVPRVPGLHVFTALGSRGIATSAIGGAVIASAIAGAPSPLERDLLDAVDPARFVSRAVRLGRQPPVGFIAEGSAGG